MSKAKRLARIPSFFVSIIFLFTQVQPIALGEPTATLNGQSQWVPTVSVDETSNASDSEPSEYVSAQDQFFEDEGVLSAPTPPPTSEQIIEDHMNQAQEVVNAVAVKSTILDFGPIESKLKETIDALKAIMKSLTDSLTEKGDDSSDIKKAEDEFNFDAGEWMKELYGRVLSAGRVPIVSIDGAVAGVVGLGAAVLQTQTYQKLKIDLKADQDVQRVQDIMLDAVKEDSFAGQILKPAGIGLLKPGTIQTHTVNPQSALNSDLSIEISAEGLVTVKYGQLGLVSGQGHIEINSRISDCNSAPCPVVYDYRLVMDSFSHSGHTWDIQIEPDPSGKESFLIKQVRLSQIPSGVANGVAITQQTITYSQNRPVFITGNNFSCPVGQASCDVETSEKGHAFEYRMAYVETPAGWKVSEFRAQMQSFSAEDSSDENSVQISSANFYTYDNQGKVFRTTGAHGNTVGGILKTTVFASENDPITGVSTQYLAPHTTRNFLTEINSQNDWQVAVDESTLRQVQYPAGGSPNTADYPVTVYSERNDAGEFVPKQVVAPYNLLHAQGYIVVGSPDVLTPGETDDIIVNGGENFPSGVTVGLGLASNDGYSGHFVYFEMLGLGLTFYDGSDVVKTLDFPREDTVELRGKNYRVSFNDAHQVVLTDMQPVTHPVGRVEITVDMGVMDAAAGMGTLSRLEIKPDGSAEIEYGNRSYSGVIELIDDHSGVCGDSPCLEPVYRIRFDKPVSGNSSGYFEVILTQGTAGESDFSVQSFKHQINTSYPGGVEGEQRYLFHYENNRLVELQSYEKSYDGNEITGFSTLSYEFFDGFARVASIVHHSTITNSLKSWFEPIILDGRQDRIYDAQGVLEHVVRIESHMRPGEMIQQAIGETYDAFGNIVEKYETLGADRDLLAQLPVRNWNALVQAADTRSQFYDYFSLPGSQHRYPRISVFSKKDENNQFAYWTASQATFDGNRFTYENYFVNGEPDLVALSESDDISYKYEVDTATFPDLSKYNWGMGVAIESWPPKSSDAPEDEYPYIVNFINRAVGIYFTDMTQDATLGYIPVVTVVDYPNEDTFELEGKLYQISLDDQGRFRFDRVLTEPITIETNTYGNFVSSPNLNVTSDIYGNATVEFDGFVASGKIDFDTMTLKIMKPYAGDNQDSSWTLEFISNDQAGYDLKSMKIDWGSDVNGYHPQQTMFFSDNLMIRKVVESVQSEGESLQVMDLVYETINGAKRLVSSQTETQSNYSGVVTENLTRRFYGYDPSGQLNVHMLSQKWTRDGVEYFRASVTHDSGNQWTTAYALVGEAARTLGVLNGLQDAAAIEAAAQSKVASWPSSLSQSSAVEKSVQYEHLDTGEWVPRLARSLQQGGTQVDEYLVMGEPDILTTETDDLLINKGGQNFPNNVTVNYGWIPQPSQSGIPSIFSDRIGFGLGFHVYDFSLNTYEVILVDYPAETQVTLNGELFDIDLNPQGQIVLNSVAFQQAQAAKIAQVQAIIDQLSDARAAAQTVNSSVASQRSDADVLSASNFQALQSSITDLRSRLSALMSQPELISMRGTLQGTIQNLTQTLNVLSQDYQQLTQINASRSGAWPSTYSSFISEIDQKIAQLNNAQVLGALQDAQTMEELNAVIIPQVSIPQELAAPQFEIYYSDRPAAVSAISVRTTGEQVEQDALNLIALTQARNARIVEADQALSALNARLSVVSGLISEAASLNAARAAVVDVETMAQMNELAAYLTNVNVTDTQKNSVQVILDAWDELKTFGVNFDSKVVALNGEKAAIESLIITIEAYKAQIQGATTIDALGEFVFPTAAIAAVAFERPVFETEFTKLDGLKAQAGDLKVQIENYLRPVLPVSAFSIPLNAEEGGVDVNVIDWNYTGTEIHAVYRRVFGELDWVKIGETQNGAMRFIDVSIDSGRAYQYEVRPVNSLSEEQVPIAVSVSANYAAAYQGLTPANVLVIMNLNDLGYVDIGAEVEGYETSNGKLDPLAEADLLRYLGLSASAWQNTDGDGVSVIPDWNVIKHADGTIEVPLGVYYGMRREIPRENLVFIANITDQERSWLDPRTFKENVTDVIVNHMAQNGITDKILSVVSAYRFPITGTYANGSPSWEYELSEQLTKAFSVSSGYPLANVGLENGRPLSRQLGDVSFIATRLDSQDVANTRRMIDDSIWAEENYHFDDANWIANESNLRAYFDYLGAYDFFDPQFKLAAEYALQSGYYSQPGDIDCDASASACALQNFMMAPDFKNFTVPQTALEFVFGKKIQLELIEAGVLSENGALLMPRDEFQAWIGEHYPEHAYQVGYTMSQASYSLNDIVRAFGKYDFYRMKSAGILSQDISGAVRLAVTYREAADWVIVNSPDAAQDINAMLQIIDPDFIASNYDLNNNGRLDSAFLRVGWYEWLQYQDYYDFARGAIAWNLDSSNGLQFRQSPSDYLRFGLLTSEQMPDGVSPMQLWERVRGLQLPGYDASVATDEEALAMLNGIISDPQLIEKWRSAQTNSNHILAVESEQMIRNLLQETETYRQTNYSSMNADQQEAITTLNRILLFYHEIPSWWSSLVHRAGSWGGTIDQFWGAGFINDHYASDGRLLRRGAVATLGAIDEPGLFGHTNPANFTYYLMRGFSFGEAVFGSRDSARYPKMAYNGDSLYRPYPELFGYANYQNISNGSRQVLSERLQGGTSLDIQVYRDYDASGRLVREKLENGTTIQYLEDGRTVFFYDNNLNLSSQRSAAVFDMSGKLLLRFDYSGPMDALTDQVMDEAIVQANGEIEIKRTYKSSDRIERFDSSGALIAIHTDTPIYWPNFSALQLERLESERKLDSTNKTQDLGVRWRDPETGYIYEIQYDDPAENIQRMVVLNAQMQVLAEAQLHDAQLENSTSLYYSLRIHNGDDSFELTRVYIPMGGPYDNAQVQVYPLADFANEILRHQSEWNAEEHVLEGISWSGYSDRSFMDQSGSDVRYRIQGIQSKSSTESVYYSNTGGRIRIVFDDQGLISNVSLNGWQNVDVTVNDGGRDVSLSFTSPSFNFEHVSADSAYQLALLMEALTFSNSILTRQGHNFPGLNGYAQSAPLQLINALYLRVAEYDRSQGLSIVESQASLSRQFSFVFNDPKQILDLLSIERIHPRTGQAETFNYSLDSFNLPTGQHVGQGLSMIAPSGDRLIFNASTSRLEGIWMTNGDYLEYEYQPEPRVRYIYRPNGSKEMPIYGLSGDWVGTIFYTSSGERVFKDKAGNVVGQSVNKVMTFVIDPSTIFSSVAVTMALAKDGDIVELPEGAFQETQTFLIDKNITIRGGGVGAVIDGNGAGNMFAVVRAQDVRFENLTFRNYNFSYLGSAEQMIKVAENAKLTLDHVVFENNIGGNSYSANLVSVDKGHLRLENFTCRNNQLGGRACVAVNSGISNINSPVSTLKVNNSIFENNTTYGGAAAIRVSGLSYADRLALGITPAAILSDMPLDPESNQRFEVVIQNTVFDGNENQYLYGYSGAVSVSGLKTFISHSDFLNTHGTALRLNGNSARVEYSLFAGNSDYYYAAVYSRADGVNGLIILDHNTFADNVLTSSASTVSGVVGIVNDHLDDMTANQDVQISSSIFYGNTRGLLVKDEAKVSVTNTLADFEIAGAGNILGDPQFVNTEFRMYQILAGSLAQSGGMAWGAKGFGGSVTVDPAELLESEIQKKLDALAVAEAAILAAHQRLLAQESDRVALAAELFGLRGSGAGGMGSDYSQLQVYINVPSKAVGISVATMQAIRDLLAQVSVIDADLSAMSYRGAELQRFIEQSQEQLDQLSAIRSQIQNAASISGLNGIVIPVMAPQNFSKSFEEFRAPITNKINAWMASAAAIKTQITDEKAEYQQTANQRSNMLSDAAMVANSLSTQIYDLENQVRNHLMPIYDDLDAEETELLSIKAKLEDYAGQQLSDALMAELQTLITQITNRLNLEDDEFKNYRDALNSQLDQQISNVEFWIVNSHHAYVLGIQNAVTIADMNALVPIAQHAATAPALSVDLSSIFSFGNNDLKLAFDSLEQQILNSNSAIQPSQASVQKRAEHPGFYIARDDWARSVRLFWNHLGPQTVYELQVSTTPDFSEDVQSMEFSSYYYDLGDIPPGGNFYYRVRAWSGSPYREGSLLSNWSEILTVHDGLFAFEEVMEQYDEVY